jgi:hypothetical protein
MATNPGLTAHIRGLKEARVAFQALPEVFRDRLGDATETTVQEIARGAQARLASSPSVRTRRLLNAVMSSFSRKTGRGRVGISNATFSGTNGEVDRPSSRAHFVEFGTKSQSAEPFMIPSAESQTQPYLERVRAAGKFAERDLASGRFT